MSLPLNHLPYSTLLPFNKLPYEFLSSERVTKDDLKINNKPGFLLQQKLIFEQELNLEKLELWIAEFYRKLTISLRL